MKILIATHNPGKKREYAALFDDPRVELTTLTEQGIAQDVEETGATFAENALLKARHYAQLTGLLTLADDSGLEVTRWAARRGSIRRATAKRDSPTPTVIACCCIT
jgi:XTP/dITP diphosphohydrolase